MHPLCTTPQQTVVDSGLWRNGRRRTHGFTLSPDAYRPTPSQIQAIEQLGLDLQAALTGISRMAAFAADPSGYHSRTWGMLNRIFRSGIPEVHRLAQVLHPDQLPDVLKVDLMETRDGSYQIAEIDGHNKHGLGYSALAAKMRRTVFPEAASYSGTVLAVADAVRRRGLAELTVLYSDPERFYLPELEVLAAHLVEQGIAVQLGSEMDCRIEDEDLFIGGEPAGSLWLDLPFMSKHPSVGAWVANRYQAGDCDLLIPPKPFLGSKSVLGVLRNDEQDEELEAILREFIPAENLERIRTLIPETYLIRKRRQVADLASLSQQAPFVLKEAISSGMKGTVFPDEPEFQTSLQKAMAAYYRYVLQRQVTNRAMSFEYFSNGTLARADWFTRVTVHFSLPSVADIIVTARQDRAVHGAPDCLQLGTVLPSQH